MQRQAIDNGQKLEEFEIRLSRLEAFNESRFILQQEHECSWRREVLFANDDELVIRIRIESTDPCNVNTVCDKYQSLYPVERNLLELKYIDDFSLMLVRERDSRLRVSFASSCGFSETHFISFPENRPMPDVNEIIAGGGVMVTSGDNELLKMGGEFPVSVKLSFPDIPAKNMLVNPSEKTN